MCEGLDTSYGIILGQDLNDHLVDKQFLQVRNWRLETLHFLIKYNQAIYFCEILNYMLLPRPKAYYPQGASHLYFLFYLPMPWKTTDMYSLFQIPPF